METKRFVLLDMDYITRNGRPIIRLFGKISGENKSIIALDKNFKPYIYILPHNIEECIAELNEFEFTEIEKVLKKESGEPKNFIKVYLKHPREMRKLERQLQKLKSVEAVMEYDIPFSRRYLIDKGIFPMSEVEINGKCINSISSENKPCIFGIEGAVTPLESDPQKLKVLSFNIEICNPVGKPSVSKDPISLISFSSNEGLRKVISTKKSSLDFVETVSNEKELIKKCIETIESEDPNIIIGYHSDNFDFPYLKQRAKKCGLHLKLGLDQSEVKFRKLGHRTIASIKGRIHIDIYRVVRRYVTLSSHTLQSVHLELFGEDKPDFPADYIYRCWNEGGEKLDKFLRYTLENAIAVTRIGERMLPLVIELTNIVGQPLFDIARTGTGSQTEWYLMRKAHEQGHIIPNKSKKWGHVIGGYVKEPVHGLHENIVYFDFRSLYPSIIISKNISPETLTEDINEECYIAPEFGHQFKKNIVGFIPLATREILENRIRIKAMMKNSTDPEERQSLDIKQSAIKILVSTIYGLFNHNSYRWYCIEASEAINAWGRDFLKSTMKDAENFGFRVLYADTDGFFATIIYKEQLNGEMGLELEARNQADEFLQEKNDNLPKGMELEFEGFYQRGLFVTKKRYALIEDENMVVKGLELVRRDWTPVAKKTQRKVLMAILKDVSPQKAAKLVKEVIDDIKRGVTPLDDLVINTQITKAPAAYVNKGPHVIAAEKSMKKGRKIGPGTIIRYVIFRGKEPISKRAIPLEDVDESEYSYKYDPSYYINNQVLPAVSRIIEALGYHKDDMLYKEKQISLDVFY